jgi:hypothetical protein
MAADAGIQRTDAVRTVTAQVDLLTDGLHALRAGRLPVTDEYIDRALTDLTALLTRIRTVRVCTCRDCTDD